MKHYFRVFVACMHNTVSYLTAYRADAIANMFLGIGWALFNILFIEIIFYHVDSFQGWSQGDVLLILMTFILCIEPGSQISRRVEYIANLVREGDFDGIISKPIDSQFLTTFGWPDMNGMIFFVFNFLPYLLLAVWYESTISFAMIPAYIIFIIAGNILWISMRSLVFTLNFWHQNLGNIGFLIHNIFQLAKYPTVIFPRFFQVLFHTALPIAFVGTIPADALRGNYSSGLLIASVGIAALSCVIARLVWLRAIRSYSSASS